MILISLVNLPVALEANKIDVLVVQVTRNFLLRDNVGTSVIITEKVDFVAGVCVGGGGGLGV